MSNTTRTSAYETRSEYLWHILATNVMYVQKHVL